MARGRSSAASRRPSVLSAAFDMILARDRRRVGVLEAGVECLEGGGVTDHDVDRIPPDRPRESRPRSVLAQVDPGCDGDRQPIELSARTTADGEHVVPAVRVRRTQGQSETAGGAGDQDAHA